MNFRPSILPLLLTVIAASASAQTFAPWTWSNPYPVGTDLTAVQNFLDGRVFVFGEGGTYLRSTDFGATWTNPGYPANLIRVTAVDFPTPSIGYILGDDASLAGRIAKTTNGGSTWQLLPYTSFAYLNSVSFPPGNALTGWVAGSGGLIIKTTNGGTSWTQQTTNVFENLVSIDFNTAIEGSATAEIGHMLDTENGGQTWTLRNTATATALKAVAYTPEGDAYAVGPGGFGTRRLAGDLAWGTVLVGTTLDLTSISHLESRVMMVTADSGIVFRRRNVLSSFLRYATGVSGRLSSIAFADTVIGWVVGAGGSLAHSTDAGRNWTAVSSGVTQTVNDIATFGGDTACTVGAQGTIMRRTSRHETWQTRLSGLSVSLNAVGSTGPGIAIAVGNGGNILRSVDAGDTWQPVASGLTTTLTGIAHCGSVTLIVGSSGKVLRSTDAGSSWSPVVSGTTAQLRGVAFASDSLVIITGSNATILRSIDAGSSWQQIASENARSCNSISFADSLRGTAVGSALDLGLPPPVIRTTDGGLTWSLALLPEIPPDFPATIIMALWTVRFAPDGTGTIVGDEGAVFRTTNSGDSWTRHLVGYNKTFRAIVQADDGHWIVGGTNGSILESTPVPTSVADEERSIVPASPILYPNFPNPFNPETMVRWQTVEEGRVRVSIFDMLGREVAVLADETLSAGQHQRVFSASKLAAGVYLCRLQASGVVQTRKMLLLK